MNKNQIRIEDYQYDEDPLIIELLKELGITEEFITIDAVSEGKPLPGGFSSESGTILTKDGKVYDYWLDWDPEKIAPNGSKGYYTLGENFKDPVTGEFYSLFKEILLESKLYPKPYDRSFLFAKKRLGIPLTQEEEKILEKYEADSFFNPYLS